MADVIMADVIESDVRSQDGDLPTRCTSAADECDLTISCTSPAPVVGSGDLVRVSWTVYNVGSGLDAGPFVVRLEMSHNGTFEEVGREPYPGVLGAGEPASGEVSFVVPPWVVSGDNELRCGADADAQVPETDEGNNEDAATLVATGLPDLQLAGVSIASMPDERDFPIQFDVLNEGVTQAAPCEFQVGGGDAAGGNTLHFGSVDRLDAGSMQHFAFSVRSDWPLSGPGTAGVGVDSAAEVAESREDNNGFTRSVTWR